MRFTRNIDRPIAGHLVVKGLVVTILVVAPLGRRVTAEESSVENASKPSVDFQRDVAPLLTKNCVACHNAKKAEGGLNLESHAAMMNGGDSGAAIEPGDIASGTLLARISDDDDPMPPDGNSVGAQRLNSHQISLLHQWIETGALPTKESAQETMWWQPLPESVHPVYALAASPDGNYVAFGRGNQAFIVRQDSLESELFAFELVDSSVQQSIRYPAGSSSTKTASHLDIVQSVAFSPDSQLLATGGYRDVKLWRRKTQPVDNLESAIRLNGVASNAALSDDGTRLAASVGSQFELVDLKSGQATRFVKSHASEITALAWLKDSSLLLSNDRDGGWVLTQAHSLQSDRLSQKNLGESISASVQSSEGDGSVSGSASYQSGYKKVLSLAKDRLAAIDQAGRLWELTLDLDRLELTARELGGFSEVSAIAVSGPEIREDNTPSDEGVADGGFSPYVAIGLRSGICRLVHADTFESLKELTTNEPVEELALSRSGGLLITSTGQSAAKLWRVEDGVCVCTFDRDYDHSQQAATAQRDVVRQQGTLDRLAARLAELTKVSEAEEVARAKVQELRDKASEELTAKVAALSGAKEAVSQAEQAVLAAENALAEAMKLVETRKAELEAQRKSVEEASSQKEKAATELANREQALATAADATQRAAQRIPETQQVISVETQKLESLQQSQQILMEQPQKLNNPRGMAFSHDSSKAVIVDDSGRQHVFSTVDGKPEAILHSDRPLVDVWSLSDGTLVGIDEQGSTLQWDLSFPWELYRTIGSFEDSPWSDRVTALDFSPDGQHLAVGSGAPSRSGEIKIIDVQTGEVAIDLGEPHSDTVFAIRFSPNGQVLASVAADKQCRLFDASTGVPQGVLEGHTHHVLALAWKDDGVTLATGSADASVKVWNVESGTQIRTLGGFKKEVTSLAFVAQSDQFIATDATGIVQLVSAGDGKQIRTFAGADGGVYAVGISSDGKLVFAGGQSGHHWAWQIEDGKKLR